jgi:RimK family alpha-L-glutamate ligase
MIEGWLIYNREDYGKNKSFADRLVESGAESGLDIRLRFANEMCIGIRRSHLHCSMPSLEPSPQPLPQSLGGGESLVNGALPRVSKLPEFVINRTRDYLLARCLEQAGCRVFNSSEAARICNDKIESHLLAARLGLPQVDTAFCRNEPASLRAHGLPYPVVLKNPCGHGGGEVFLANDEGELTAAASLIRRDRVIVQRLCGRPGEDVRVYMLGGKILAAVKRRAAGGDFRANLSLGGSAEPYEPDDNCRRMAERISEALWLDYAGIDFLSDENGGLLFNELEDAVGSRALYGLGICDAAALYMDYISKTVDSIKT